MEYVPYDIWEHAGFYMGPSYVQIGLLDIAFFQKGNSLLLITIFVQGAFKHFARELLREDSL